MKKVSNILLPLLIALFFADPVSAQLGNGMMILTQGIPDSEVVKQPFRVEKRIDENKKEIHIDFQLDAVWFEDNPFVQGAKSCRIPGMDNINIPGVPQLPALDFSWNIDNYSTCAIKVDDIETATFNFTAIGGYTPIASDARGELSIDPIEPYTGSYPEKPFFEAPLQLFNGSSILHYSLVPVSYNYETSTFEVIKRCHIVIQYSLKERTLSTKPLYVQQKRQNQLKQTCEVIDWDDESEFKEYPKETTEDYLILSVSTLKEEIERFAEWKRSLGYRVTVHAEKSTMTWQEMQYIINSYYQKLDNLSYVFIVGHSALVPGIPFTEFKTCRDKQHADVHYDNAASYTAYALTDGEDDYTPEFAVGFQFASNPKDLREIFDKIIQYEKEPVADPLFYTTSFMAGCFEGEGTDASDGKRTTNPGVEDYGSIQALERVRPMITASGIEPARIYKRHKLLADAGEYPSQWTRHPMLFNPGSSSGYIPADTSRVIPDYLRYPAFAWDGNKQQVMDKLRAGSLFGIYYGHGNCNGWESLDRFNATDFRSSSYYPKNPFIMSVSCGTGQSYWNGSFGNMVTACKGGAIAMFAACEISYVRENTMLLYGLVDQIWPSNDKNLKKYNGPWPNDYHVGRILLQAMGFTESAMSGDIHNTFKQYQKINYTCFGDPATQFNTQVPEKFNDPNFVSFGPTVFVSIPECEIPQGKEVRVNFHEKSSGRVESFVYDGPDYYFEALPESKEVEVSLTCHNKVPYFTTLQVNDGNSFVPKGDGRIETAFYDAASGILSVNVWASIADSELQYLVADNTLESIEYMGSEIIRDEYSTINIYVGRNLKGYVQLRLVNETHILDTKKILVQ